MNSKENIRVEAELEVPEFKGYSIEELRYQRNLVALRKDFCKVRLLQSIATLNPLGEEKRSGIFGVSKPKRSRTAFGIAAKVASSLLGNLNKLDYIVVALSLFGTIKKGVSLIRKKKK